MLDLGFGNITCGQKVEFAYNKMLPAVLSGRVRTIFIFGDFLHFPNVQGTIDFFVMTKVLFLNSSIMCY